MGISPHTQTDGCRDFYEKLALDVSKQEWQQADLQHFTNRHLTTFFWHIDCM